MKKLSNGKRGVARKLRNRGKTQRRKDKVEIRGKIVINNTINMRPKEVNERKEIGHWQTDTILGKRNTGCLVTLSDSYSRYYIVQRVLAKASKPVADKTIEAMNQLPIDKVKTIHPIEGKSLLSIRWLLYSYMFY